MSVEHAIDFSSSLVLTHDGLQGLIDVLQGAGYTVIGPRVAANGIVLDEIERIADLPAGWSDDQEGGRYRLRRTGTAELFAFAATAQGWKRHFYPPDERLWTARRQGDSFSVAESADDSARADAPCAILGARACDLAGLAVLDRVLGVAGANDGRYRRRRKAAFLIAVDCARPAATCFCVSMGAGPAAHQGFDLALTELCDDHRHEFLVRVGSRRGESVLRRLQGRSVGEDDLAAADRQRLAAASGMRREMAADAAEVLRRNLAHGRWRETAERCLACGNCTSVCPTCFCATVVDATRLDGVVAERRRVWDSCFTVGFSFLHGGSIRQSGAARYRQWITHKLSFWHEQFGMSGCVGCGRCITWCPVGIDITEEVRAVRDGAPAESSW